MPQDHQLMDEEDDVVHDDNLSYAAYVFAVWNLIIRPPRERYTRQHSVKDFPLGRFRFASQAMGGSDSTIASRTDYELQNVRGMKLVCSLFQPEQANVLGERACVVFCHGNGSSRLSGFDLVPLLLPLNIGLCCFDFAGSGMSGGDYVSLGYHERDDLACVIENLRDQCGYNRIGLWGVSMGAATALMHAARDPSIAGIVADSPFSDLTELIKEILAAQLRLPSFLVPALLAPVRFAIRTKAAFDIRDVSPIAHVGKCFVPTLFLHGTYDDFVVPTHTEKLQREHAGEKQRLLMPHATHTTRRTAKFKGRSVLFLLRAMRWEKHLPTGVTEESINQLAAGISSYDQQDLQREREVADAARRLVDSDVRLLLSSARNDLVSLGLVRAACELCGAYRGAALLLCTGSSDLELGDLCKRFQCDAMVPDHIRNAAYRAAKSPARFRGRVCFSATDERGELALCWIRCGAAKPQGGRVGFAVISPCALSLTAVVLSQEGDLDTVCRNASALGGFTCAAVEPIAVTDVNLTRGCSHRLSLQVAPDGKIELQVGETSVSACMDEHPHSGSADDSIHLWCMQWGGASGSACDPVAKLELAAESVKLGLTNMGPSVALAGKPPGSPLRTLGNRGGTLPKSPGMAVQSMPSTALSADAGAYCPIVDSTLQRVECGTLRPFEERLAEDLATLCLGTLRPETLAAAGTSQGGDRDASSNMGPYRAARGTGFSSMTAEAGDLFAAAPQDKE